MKKEICLLNDKNKSFRFIIQTTECRPVLYCKNMDTVNSIINHIKEIDTKYKDNTQYELVDRQEKTIIVL
mgnify:FL=1